MNNIDQTIESGSILNQPGMGGVKERPILFSAPMVRAILSGQKTQTRRILKNTGLYAIEPHHGAETAARERAALATQCPYGKPGDRLWVRETWRTDESLNDKAPSAFAGWPVRYEADGSVLQHGAFFGNTNGKTRVSIHMPRWACRINLEIAGVRVERLQEISTADCIAEGCAGGHGSIPGYGYAATAKEHYFSLWESLNGEGSVKENPWLWVIDFKVLP